MHVKSTHPVVEFTKPTPTILEVKLRVRWENVAEFFERYSAHFLELDLDEGADSGRTLKHAWLRDVGDEHNVILVFEYDPISKQEYYEKYCAAYVAAYGLDAKSDADAWRQIRSRELRLFELVESDVANLHFAVDFDELRAQHASGAAPQSKGKGKAKAKVKKRKKSKQ